MPLTFFTGEGQTCVVDEKQHAAIASFPAENAAPNAVLVVTKSAQEGEVGAAAGRRTTLDARA